MKLFLTLVVLISLISQGNCAEEVKISSKSYDIISTVDKNTTIQFGLMMDAYCEFLKGEFKITGHIRRLPLRIFGGDKSGFDAYAKTYFKNFNDKIYGFCQYGNDPELAVYYDGTYKGIFFHEGLHQFIGIISGELLSCPQWFNEGLASYLETADYKNGKIILGKSAHPGYYRTVNALNDSKKLTPLKDFMAITLADWNKSGNDYAIGACMIDFFLNNKNALVRSSYSQFIFDIKRWKSYDRAFTESYGKLDYAVLDVEFIKWIRSHG